MRIRFFLFLLNSDYIEDSDTTIVPYLDVLEEEVKKLQAECERERRRALHHRTLAEEGRRALEEREEEWRVEKEKYEERIRELMKEIEEKKEQEVEIVEVQEMEFVTIEESEGAAVAAVTIEDPGDVLELEIGSEGRELELELEEAGVSRQRELSPRRQEIRDRAVRRYGTEIGWLPAADLCYYCFAANHTYKRCPETFTRSFCFGCGRQGVKSSECWSAKCIRSEERKLRDRSRDRRGGGWR